MKYALSNEIENKIYNFSVLARQFFATEFYESKTIRAAQLISIIRNNEEVG